MRRRFKATVRGNPPENSLERPPEKGPTVRPERMQPAAGWGGNPPIGRTIPVMLSIRVCPWGRWKSRWGCRLAPLRMARGKDGANTPKTARTHNQGRYCFFITTSVAELHGGKFLDFGGGAAYWPRSLKITASELVARCAIVNGGSSREPE